MLPALTFIRMVTFSPPGLSIPTSNFGTRGRSPVCTHTKATQMMSAVSDSARMAGGWLQAVMKASSRYVCHFIFHSSKIYLFLFFFLLSSTCTSSFLHSLRLTQRQLAKNNACNDLTFFFPLSLSLSLSLSPSLPHSSSPHPCDSL